MMPFGLFRRPVAVLPQMLQVRWAGHNKWSKIFRGKAIADQARNLKFTKSALEIISAVKAKGPDPALNHRLAMALENAKAINMPRSNIESALTKAQGKSEADMEEITFEAHGPSGVAFIIETLTDKRTRTVPNLRAILKRHEGSLGVNGAVQWMFHRKGVIELAKDSMSVDQALELAIEVGAEDAIDQGDGEIELLTDPASLAQCRTALQERNVVMGQSEVRYIPVTMAPDNPDLAGRLAELISTLEEQDDVIRVSHNYVWPESTEEE